MRVAKKEKEEKEKKEVKEAKEAREAKVNKSPQQFLKVPLVCNFVTFQIDVA